MKLNAKSFLLLANSGHIAFHGRPHRAAAENEYFLRVSP